MTYAKFAPVAGQKTGSGIGLERPKEVGPFPRKRCALLDRLISKRIANGDSQIVRLLVSQFN